MARGYVTTARGEQLNLDQLIIDSKRPPGLKEQATEVKKRKIPKRKPLNVRGFKPAAGEAKAQEMPEEMRQVVRKTQKKPEKPRKVAFKEGGTAETYADLVGVRVKPTEGAVERRKAQLAKAQDEAVETQDDELKDVLAELEAHDEDMEPETAPTKPTTRRARKKTT